MAQCLDSARENLIKSRYFVCCIVLPWKIIAIFGFLYATEYQQNGIDDANMLFRNFTQSFNESTVPIIRNKGDTYLLGTEKHLLFVRDTLWPLWFLLMHITANYVCYAFAKFTCKICIQGKGLIGCLFVYTLS